MIGWVMVLASCLCFGITNCLWAVMQKKEQYINVIVYRTIVTCSLFSAYLLLCPEPTVLGDTLYNWRTWATALGISMASCCGLLCYVYSLRFTTVNIAVPLSSVNALFGVLTALIFLGEPFRFSLLVAFSAVTAALWLLQQKGGSFQ